MDPTHDDDLDTESPAPTEIKLWGDVLVHEGELVSHGEVFRRMDELPRKYPGTYWRTEELTWVVAMLRGKKHWEKPVLDAPPLVVPTCPLPEKGAQGMSAQECQAYLDNLTRIIDNETRYVSQARDPHRTPLTYLDHVHEAREELWEHERERDRFLVALGSATVSEFYHNRTVPPEDVRMVWNEEAEDTDMGDVDDDLVPTV